MKYKTTITNLGRNHATVIKESDSEPDYGFLRGMVGGHLASSDIDFLAKDDGYPMTGRVVVGGFRPVGEILIEQVEA